MNSIKTSKRNTIGRPKREVISDEKFIEKENKVLKQMEWIKGISLRIDNENQELTRKKHKLKENYEKTFLDNNCLKE